MATRAKKTITLMSELPDDCLPMCKTCNAYVKFDEIDQGTCRANPPQTIVVNDELDAVFPVVLSHEWCRRYERKTN